MKLPSIKPVMMTIAAVAGVLFILHGAWIFASSPATDTFTDTSKIASNNNLTVDTVNGQVKLSLSVDFTCGGTWTDSRDGKTYATVMIGSQCWMAQNINVGTKVAGSGNQGSNCASIQKYCYSDNEANCTTYGGLYQWDQAMCGSVTAGAQGICPVGWHIPTHDQFTTLERAICVSGTCTTDFPFDTSTTGWRGTNEGTNLKSGGSSGFNGLLAGYRSTDGSFGTLTAYGYFWTSLQSGANAWGRYPYSGRATVCRFTDDKLYGFSVRCLKD